METITLHDGRTSPRVEVPLHQRVFEFLIQVMGGDELAARRQYVTAFAEDPVGDYDRDTRARMWGGGEATARRLARIRDADNCYLAVSTFKPDADGKTRRRQAQFEAARWIMIDDVGDGPSAKIDPLLVSLDPTWAVETSPGNRQLWYRLDPPVTDAALYNRVVDALVHHGLAAPADPGMKGVTRYGRLPFGRNTKAKYTAAHPGGFPMRLVPEITDFSRTYSLEAFAAAWGISGALAPSPVDVALTAPLSGAPGVDTLNARLLEELAPFGPAPKPGASGIYTLAECPWSAEHGEGAGSDGAAVFLIGATDGAECYGRGAFRCHHGHGEHDRLPQLLDRLGLTADFKLIEASAEFGAEPIDFAALKAESAAIGEGDPGQPREALARYGLTTLDEMVERFAFAEAGGYVIDVHRPKLTMPLATFRAATEALSVPHPSTGAPTPMARAWQRHPRRITVVGTTFYPGQPIFCDTVEEGTGYDAVNIWRPIVHVAPPGWEARAHPFIEHIAYLVPIEAERERFLSWLAHIEQAPADRPHSHYLLVSDRQGIGRSYVGAVLARVWPRYTALNFDLVRMLSSGFSGRLSSKLLAVVDEIAEGGGDRWAHAETLKSLLTSDHIEINVKYGAQRVERNCIRFLMFSNHVAAIPLDDTDRRWNIIRNPSEPRPPDYYRVVYGQLCDPDYIAAVREWLRRRDLSRFDPFARPEINAAKAEMIAASLTDAEQHYIELSAEHPADVIEGSRLVSLIYGPLAEYRKHASHLANIVVRRGGRKLGRVRVGDGSEARLTMYALRRVDHWKALPGEAWLAESRRC